MTMQSKRVLFLGDTHGDLNHLIWAIGQAKRLDCDEIVQVGDFGYWEHTQRGITFLFLLNFELEQAGLKIHWVDGNHENHTMLRELYQLREDGMVEVRPNIIYIPRGVRWEWGGVSFLGIGGAYSIDKWDRTTGISWWPEEMITDEEVDTAVSGGRVDVVVSHDVPRCVDLYPHLAAIGVTRPWKWDENSMANRRKLDTVFDGVHPKRWYHGHYHLRYSDSFDGCRFTGLAANINQFNDRNWKWEQSVAVLQTDEV